MKRDGIQQVKWYLIYWVLVLITFLKVINAHWIFASYLIALPALFAALTLWFLIGKKELGIALALFFSCLGDLSGSLGCLVLQIIFFALAHGCFIITFLSKADFSLKRIASSVGIVILAVVYALTIIHNGEGIFRGLFVVYAVIVSAMCASTILYKGSLRFIFMGAGILFLISDSLIAWNMFVKGMNVSNFWIMICYYLAQFLFFYGAVKRQENKTIFWENTLDLKNN